MASVLERTVFGASTRLGEDVIYRPSDGSAWQMIKGSFHTLPAQYTAEDRYDKVRYDAILYVSESVRPRPARGAKYEIGGKLFYSPSSGHVDRGSVRIDVTRTDTIREHANSIRSTR